MSQKNLTDAEREAITTIVAIGPFCWGYADVTDTRDRVKCREAAIRKCKSAAPGASTINPGKHAIKVFEVTGMTGVSGMGAIMTTDKGTAKKLPDSFLIVRRR